MVTLTIIAKIHFHHEMNLSELTFILLKSSLMILVGIKGNYFAQIGFIMEAIFGSHPLHG